MTSQQNTAYPLDMTVLQPIVNNQINGVKLISLKNIAKHKGKQKIRVRDSRQAA